jgi:hypothetical protein
MKPAHDSLSDNESSTARSSDNCSPAPTTGYRSERRKTGVAVAFEQLPDDLMDD